MLTEFERKEMQEFDTEFNMLIQESAQVARKEGGGVFQSQRKEILIPFAQIKNKLQNA